MSGDDTPPLKKSALPILLAGAVGFGTWGWGFIKDDIALRAEAAELRAENKAYKRQAQICQDITEQSIKLIAAARKEKK